MKTFLYILLGLSLGSGLTLIAIQERFMRERRRLLAMGESQRAKAAEVAESILNKQWESKFQQQAEELQACQAQLATAGPCPTPGIDAEECVLRSEHEQLLHEKNLELARLTTENTTLVHHLDSHQEKINDLHDQLARLEEEKKLVPDDDFLLLGQPGGHLLPGSVVRAFIKGRQGAS